MRVQTGGAITVTATERWLSEVRAGRAFSLGIVIGATVGETSHVQLFNPAGSAVTVIVRSLVVSLSATDIIRVMYHNVALANDSAGGVNLLSGGAAGIAHIRYLSGVAAGSLFGDFYAPAASPVYVTPDWYVELGAGEGMLVRPNSVNIGIGAVYSWIEV